MHEVRGVTSSTEGGFKTRCAFLIKEDDTVVPVPPSSKYDLSKACIAFTAPRGTVIPPDNTTASKIGILTRDSLSDFIKEARALESPTDEALAKLLPRSFRVRSDTLRHLYRNFADCSRIDCSPGDDGDIAFSRREVDIVNYFFYSGKLARDMATLIPYRTEGSIIQNAKIIERMGLCCSEEYVKMLIETVGKLDSLEKEVAELAPVKKVRTKKIDANELRQQLSEEERNIVPDWAVKQMLDWKQLVCNGDPRPVFGCDWCGPKIHVGYKGPFSITSELCPSCEGLKSEGFSFQWYQSTSNKTKRKTFYKDGERVYWDSKNFLLGTTNTVAAKKRDREALSEALAEKKSALEISEPSSADAGAGKESALEISGEPSSADTGAGKGILIPDVIEKIVA